MTPQTWMCRNIFYSNIQAFIYGLLPTKWNLMLILFNVTKAEQLHIIWNVNLINEFQHEAELLRITEACVNVSQDRRLTHSRNASWTTRRPPLIWVDLEQKCSLWCNLWSQSYGLECGHPPKKPTKCQLFLHICQKSCSEKRVDGKGRELSLDPKEKVIQVLNSKAGV